VRPMDEFRVGSAMISPVSSHLLRVGFIGGIKPDVFGLGRISSTSSSYWAAVMFIARADFGPGR